MVDKDTHEHQKSRNLEALNIAIVVYSHWKISRVSTAREQVHDTGTYGYSTNRVEGLSTDRFIVLSD